MFSSCIWDGRAQLHGPDRSRMLIAAAYGRASAGFDLCLDPEDDALPAGLVFGPALQDPRLITRSGGSTGQPRRILRNQASWAASFDVMAKLYDLSPADRYGILGDLSHSLSFYALAEGLHLGADVHLSLAPRPAAMAQLLSGAEITVLYATPTQLRALDMALPAGQSFPSVRALFAGGGPFDGAAGRAVLARFPKAQPVLFYGSSETSFLTIGPPREDGSADAFPGADLVVQAPDGQRGLLWAGGPYLAHAYGKGDPGPAPRRDAQGRIALGDEAMRLPQGRLRLFGRGSAMITIADRNVFPAAVEDWLLAQPGIGHAAVLPRLDALRGHRLEAAICWDGGDLSRLRADLRRDLGQHATPSRILELPDWPLLPSGKTDLAQLRRALEL
ncbi:MAG: fatty acid--CoA ligase family protein [Mangrovicoccus sp.]|nr:fatty acid--CoA ligase family protein [Mangrovicoccus sp.]